jgi:alkylation response protein AidB-like acyl-CoA dehydrogenase
VTATPAHDGLVLSGRVAVVEGARDAAHVLVTADGPEGRAQLLVPTATPGVELVGLRGIDLTRRYDDVLLHDVAVGREARVGAAGSADEHDAELLDLVLVMLLGEMVGAMARAFAMTLEWTGDRYSFGRPLGSYQAIKHRVADLRTQLEASEAVAARAADALGRGDAHGRAWSRAGMVYVAQRAPELIQECIQLHGGIGVTYEHDLHLFLRRATTDARLFGSWQDFARDLGGQVAEAVA